MGELGFSINFWKLEFAQSENEFQFRDTVSFVFQDRPPEEWTRLGNVIEELVGDNSLGRSVADILSSVKTEVPSDGDPMNPLNPLDPLDPLVKIEGKEAEEEEEDDEEFNPNDYDNLVVKNGHSEDEDDTEDSEDDDEDDDWNDDLSEEETRVRSRRKPAEVKEKEYCEKCGKGFIHRKNLVDHLSHCNPDQIDRLPERKPPPPVLAGGGGGRKRGRKPANYTEACDKCEKEFKHREDLTDHLEDCNPAQLDTLPRQRKRKQYNMDSRENSCRYCHREFIFKKSLQKHEELHRTDPDNVKLKLEDGGYAARKLKGSKGVKRKGPGGESMPRGMYQCDKCECDFKVFSALERHMKAHDLATKSQPDTANIEEGKGYKMIDVRDGKSMRCMRCDLAFTTHGIYRLHMQKFHKKAFPCEECSKRFTLPNTLVKHRLNYHTNFPKSCDDCGLVLSTKHSFVKHVNTVHSSSFQESTVPCEICGKLVKNKYTLKQHVKLVHEKKKGEFACDQCGKVLKSKGSLDYHKRTHTGEYAYRCDECGRGHMRYDKMMECLAEHQGKVVKKYACPHCEYKSNEPKAYKNHLTTHSDAKPFSCPVCGHLSSTSANLNSHTSKVHKITLCQAEGMMKRNRHGKDMNEEELEQNRITLQRNSKHPGDGRSIVAEARKRGKTARPHSPSSNTQDQHQGGGVGGGGGGGGVLPGHPGLHHPPASAASTPPVSWESGMARLEAGLRQQQQDEMAARHELGLTRHDPRLDHLNRMGESLTVPKQERNFGEEAAAANLVMPRHMLFPVHKYFQ